MFFQPQQNYKQRPPFPSGLIDVILKPDKVMGSLLISGVEATQNEQLLNSHKVQAILTIGSELTNVEFPTDNIKEHLVIKIQDQANQNISNHFQEAIDFIEKQRAQKRNVLVHCYVGVSRSATLVIIYLMWKLNLSFQEAIQEVRKQRPYINPNQGFIQQMQRYEIQRKSQQRSSSQQQLYGSRKKSQSYFSEKPTLTENTQQDEKKPNKMYETLRCESPFRSPSQKSIPMTSKSIPMTPRSDKKVIPNALRQSNLFQRNASMNPQAQINAFSSLQMTVPQQLRYPTGNKSMFTRQPMSNYMSQVGFIHNSVRPVRNYIR